MTKTFCQRLYQLGMLSGGNPEDAFYVKCDTETNPPDEVAKGLLTCQVGVAPVIPAEFIVIQVTQTMNTGA
jgi:phage tail sheath protein FI